MSSSTQPYQHKHEYQQSADEEMDAMLNSLGGPSQTQSQHATSFRYDQQQQQQQQQPSSSQSYQNYYYSYNQSRTSAPGPPPPLPPRNEYNGYIRNSTEPHTKYYYQTTENNNNSYGYPPPQPYPSYSTLSNYRNHLPTTPLPQRVSSVTAQSFPVPERYGYATPSAAASSSASHMHHNVSMPVPQHHHQRNSSNSSNSGTVYPPYDSLPPPPFQQSTSPPGSPQQQQQQIYPPIGYPDATQEIINNSYRPTFTQQASDPSTFVSTPSSISATNTPPPLPTHTFSASSSSNPSTSQLTSMSGNNGVQPMPSVASNNMTTTTATATTAAATSKISTPYRKPHSSLRNNMITTIERPRYSYLPEHIDTNGMSEENGEMPFIPVSPDTDSDEDEDYFNPKNEYLQKPQQADDVDFHKTTKTTDNYNSHQQQQQAIPPTNKLPQHIDPTAYYLQQQSMGDFGYPSFANSSSINKEAILHQSTHHLENTTAVDTITQQRLEGSVELTAVATEQQGEEVVKEITPLKPNYGLVSVLSVAFIRHVKGLEHVRELWCASEYNESFTGAEAMTIIRNLLEEQVVPDEYCIQVANVLMRDQLFSPTQYSQKSLISNFVNADDTYFLEEDITESNVSTGVLPSLTPCYSYACRSGLKGCYSYSCPNTGKDFIVDNKIEAHVSLEALNKTITSPAGGWLVSHDAWSARMDREFLKTLDPKEIGRQEVLNETIYSEEKYLADLRILHEVIVTGIETSGVIEKSRVASFISTVFNNYQELIQMSESMFNDMLARYRQYEGECVPTIGDILVQHMQFFEEAYVKYSPHALLAKYLAEAEIKKNPEFERFAKELAKHDRTNRLPIWHYLLCPVTRMQRYPLLIEALLKKTPEDHPDYVFLTRSHDIIRSVATKADNAALHIKKRLAILHIRDSTTFKQGEYYELQLSDPNRRLYHKGTLRRRIGTHDAPDKNDIYAFVFDHMLVMTKLRKTNTGEEYRIWKKPIPLQMLVVQKNTSNLRNHSSGTTSSLAGYVNGSWDYSSPNAGQLNGNITLILHHLGSRGGTVYPFFCSSVEEKQTWVKAIEDAKASLKKRQGDTDVFELRPLDDVNFRNTATSGVASGFTTRINCSVPFISLNEEKKIAIGTDNGVFFKTEGQDNSVRRIIQCESVVQLAVMEKYHILIVLTEKALRAYPLDTLDCKSNTKAIDRIEVEIAQHVNFFQTGHCNGRDLLVYKKKKNTASVFTALEPFCNLRDPKNEKLLTHRPSIFSNRPDYLKWFKKYKDFYIGADASNIHFLKAKLNVVCERGFEVIDPENLTVGRDIPDSEDPEFYFVTRHQEPLKPLAMYRINDKFLLCYDKFAFYVNNRNGSLVPRADKRKPATICEWEGSPTHIVYEHPYIIAIDPFFIEVRHVDTGELVQIISGENIRLAYYNGGGEKPIIHVCMTHSQKPDTQALFHLTMNNSRHSTAYSRR